MLRAGRAEGAGAPQNWPHSQLLPVLPSQLCLLLYPPSPSVCVLEDIAKSMPKTRDPSLLEELHIYVCCYHYLANFSSIFSLFFMSAIFLASWSSILHIYTHTYTRMTQTHTLTRTHAHMHACTHTHTHARTHAHTLTHLQYTRY